MDPSWGIEGSLEILAHRTSDDEQLGCVISEPKPPGIFRFHEIKKFSFGEPLDP